MEDSALALVTSTSINRSDKFYFPHGDLVLRVENTLFRLHRDILATHSGFFRGHVLDAHKRRQTIHSALQAPISTEDGLPPTHTSQATVALQMSDTREFILTQLNKDVPNLKRGAAKLLRISLDYEEAPRSLSTACLGLLAYRRKPITPDEVRVLGENGTSLVSRTREGVRESLSSWMIKQFQQIAHGECILNAFSRILRTPSDEKLRDTSDRYDIFLDASSYVTCDRCSQVWEKTVKALESLSTEVVENCIKGLEPAISTNQAETTSTSRAGT
ncbi:hypothetical protein B0J17DRAFT_707614 [Rhizoctonia solani]|nr:hypothetical protein B0J17DRAFT_707614 [Rhizoctonia solani]